MNKPAKVSESVAREILKEIIERDLQPGTRLPAEEAMLDKFGVGRASLREALRILEMQGLLTIRSGRGGGPIVSDASGREYARATAFFYMAQRATYRELIEARAESEPVIARLVAQRNDRAVARRLRANIDQHHAVLTAGDGQWSEVASGFHVLLGELSNNRVMSSFALSLIQMYREHLPPVRYGQQRREEILAEHTGIATAAAAGDGEQAQRLMRDHMGTMARAVRNSFAWFLDETVDWG